VKFLIGCAGIRMEHRYAQRATTQQPDRFPHDSILIVSARINGAFSETYQQ
jgi:hypothetical protein